MKKSIVCFTISLSFMATHVYGADAAESSLPVEGSSATESSLTRSNSSPNLLKIPKDAGEYNGKTFNFDQGKFASKEPGERDGAPLPSEEAYLLSDANHVAVTVHKLAENLGVFEENSRKIIDISYPSITRYVRKLEKEGKFEEKKKVLEKINEVIAIDISSASNKESAVEELLTQASEVLLVMDGYPEKDIVEDEGFRKVFAETAINSTGEQLIKKCLILKILIDNKIGIVGSSFYCGKKIRLDPWEKLDAGGIYYSESPRLVYRKSPNGLPSGGLVTFGQGDETDRCPFLHELVHAFHDMLGFTLSNKVEKANIAAVWSDKSLRESLIPLLNEDVCASVREMLKKLPEGALDKFELSWRIRDVQALLTSYKFFGSKSLEQVGKGGNNADLALMSLIHIFVEKWSNMEEMLTIIGFSPLKLKNGTEYLIVDRQNESTASIRDFDRFRMLHSGKKNMEYIFNEEKESNTRKLLEAIFAAMDQHKVRPYARKDDMPATIARTHDGENPKGTAEKVTEEELNEAVRIWAGDRRKGYEPGAEYVRSGIRDAANYGALKGVRLSQDVVFEVLKEVPGVAVDVLKNFLEGKNEIEQKKELRAAFEIAREWNREEFILDCARELLKGTELSELLPEELTMGEMRGLIRYSLKVHKPVLDSRRFLKYLHEEKISYCFSQGRDYIQMLSISNDELAEAVANCEIRKNGDSEDEWSALREKLADVKLPYQTKKEMTDVVATLIAAGKPLGNALKHPGITIDFETCLEKAINAPQHAAYYFTVISDFASETEWIRNCWERRYDVGRFVSQRLEKLRQDGKFGIMICCFARGYYSYGVKKYLINESDLVACAQSLAEFYREESFDFNAEAIARRFFERTASFVRLDPEILAGFYASLPKGKRQEWKKYLNEKFKLGLTD